MRRRALGALLAVAGGCAITPPPPPELQTYELGTLRASYRDYRGAQVGICDAEPRWLFDELSNVNALLYRFLEETDPREAAGWSERQRTLVAEAPQGMGALLDAHAASLSAARSCGFASQRGYPDILARGEELVAASRARLGETQQVMAYLQAKAAWEKWTQEQPLRRAAAREGCPSRGGADTIYFAAQDAQGRTRWLFCDGAQVTLAAGGQRELTPPEGLSRWEQRRLKPARYYKVVERYPKDMVQRPPPRPEAPAALAEELP